MNKLYYTTKVHHRTKFCLVFPREVLHWDICIFNVFTPPPLPKAFLFFGFLLENFTSIKSICFSAQKTRHVQSNSPTHMHNSHALHAWKFSEHKKNNEHQHGETRALLNYLLWNLTVLGPLNNFDQLHEPRPRATCLFIHWNVQWHYN